MQRNGESITGTTPGLAPWQCYGPSTRRGERVYVHLLMRPYDTATIRGVRTKRLRAVTSLASGRALEFRTRVGVIAAMYHSDPIGEVIVSVPESEIDEYATVLALDFEGDPVE
jgi:alpha-L-fucosidase